MKRISTLIKSLGLTAVIMLAGIVSVQAVTLTVDTAADSGVGSLRQALNDAIGNGAANDIVFAIPTTDPGYDLGTNRFTILLASPLPNIPVPATTITNGQTQAITVRGDDTFTILTLTDSAAVIINNLTISHGSVIGNGGGILMGSSSALTLNDSTIFNNHASALGGGIFVGSSASLVVNRTTFDSNSSNYGGAIFPYLSSTVTIDNSTLRGNSAIDSGGALYVESASTLTATNNTFDGNTAGNNGGAILNQATITLLSNTITGNSANNGGGIANFGAAATLNNNIVALNTSTYAKDLLGDGKYGTSYTGDYNLIGNADGCVGLGSASNKWGWTGNAMDPILGPLQNNGGPTFTRVPRFNSPVLDQGNAPGLLTDQRGLPRPMTSTALILPGDGSDMGAVELQLSPSAANVSISGRVVTSALKRASGIANALIVVTGMSGESWSARSNPLGYFEVTGIPAGSLYSINVTRKGYTFDMQTLNVVDDERGLLFYPQATELRLKQ